jgi:hypothetical protein
MDLMITPILFQIVPVRFQIDLLRFITLLKYFQIVIINSKSLV